MKIRTLGVLLLSLVPAVWSQEPQAGKAAVQQRVAELKESVAANQAQLKKYQWMQTTEVSVKGETKKTEQSQCRYGPDGKVQKTSVGAPAESAEQHKRGLKGRVVEKKVGEMKDYTERLKTLISHYAPPDPQKIQAAAQAGKANLSRAEGAATLTLSDYYKPGDQVAFTLDPATKKLRSFNVNTYLDDPKKDVVTLTNEFATLPDGTNYVQQTVLDAKGKQIQIKTTNSDHQLVAQ